MKIKSLTTAHIPFTYIKRSQTSTVGKLIGKTSDPFAIQYIRSTDGKICTTVKCPDTGTFQATMAVRLVNDGPVTMMLDSTKLF